MKNQVPIAIAATLTSAASLSADVKNMTVPEIKHGYQRHAALAQFHRWYLIYENPEYGMKNQLDILTPDITVKSGLGEASGHEAYAARVHQLPKTWKNAHEVKATRVSFPKDGKIALEADVTYLNRGLLPDGKVRTADLTYRTTLTGTDDLLPKFSTIEIKQNSEDTVETFTPAYAHNRVKSLAHYWLALIEDPKRDPEPVREILAPDFSLNFSSGKITDFDGFKAWLAGPASQVAASTHEISDFKVLNDDDGQLQISMTLDWNGILPNDVEMTAKTAHTWTVLDTPTERFPRIKTIDVKLLEPFKPKAKAEKEPELTSEESP